MALACEHHTRLKKTDHKMRKQRSNEQDEGGRGLACATLIPQVKKQSGWEAASTSKLPHQPTTTDRLIAGIRRLSIHFCKRSQIVSS